MASPFYHQAVLLMSLTNPSAPNNHPAGGSFPSLVSPSASGVGRPHRSSSAAAAAPLNNLHLNVAAAADTAERIGRQ